MQVTQDGRGDGGLGLGGGEFVVLAAGQMLVASGIDRVRPLGALDRSPRGQTQAGSALAGEFGASGERAGQLLSRCQTSVFDQGSGGGELGGVGGFGQNRRCTDRREPGDGGDQVGEPKLVRLVGDWCQDPIPARIWSRCPVGYWLASHRVPCGETL